MALVVKKACGFITSSPLSQDGILSCKIGRLHHEWHVAVGQQAFYFAGFIRRPKLKDVTFSIDSANSGIIFPKWIRVQW